LALTNLGECLVDHLDGLGQNDEIIGWVALHRLGHWLFLPISSRGERLLATSSTLMDTNDAPNIVL